MIRHLMRLAWRRRGSNALVAVEIAGCFVVLALVASLGAQAWRSSRLPLGFRGDDTWVVEVHASDTDRSEWTPAELEAFAMMLSEARGVDGVVKAAGCTGVPYDSMERNWQFRSAGDLIDAEFNVVTDDFADVMGLELLAGRWFDASDEGAEPRPAIIDTDFARRLEASGDALGRLLPKNASDDPEMRVVGIVRDYREGGEMSRMRPYFFLRKPLAGPTGGVPLQDIVLKMRPDASASIEPVLLARLRAAGSKWQLDVRPLSRMRSTYVSTWLAPFAAGVAVALFLLATVALGLVGVLWQNVTRRTQELALRRAVGSTASGIRALVVGELLVVAGAAIAVTSLLAVQVPLLGLVPTIDAPSHALGLAVAAAFVLGVVVLCGLHPGSLAMRAMPAEALRSE